MDGGGTMALLTRSLSESPVINLHFFWHLINAGFDISWGSFGRKSIWLHSTCLGTRISCPDSLRSRLPCGLATTSVKGWFLALKCALQSSFVFENDLIHLEDILSLRSYLSRTKKIIFILLSCDDSWDQLRLQLQQPCASLSGGEAGIESL